MANLIFQPKFNFLNWNQPASKIRSQLANLRVLCVAGAFKQMGQSSMGSKEKEREIEESANHMKWGAGRGARSRTVERRGEAQGLELQSEEEREKPPRDTQDSEGG
ncbi:uncharacterized protein LOC117181106 [Belonocnema kinseyi]|uniref:uncharacterized protein LOC117181106 n=1 Tax=Belonocnema kinseyi TaxID=2817044 RepID=UPI00143D3C97|nr:uncharacterized protein LOC117181106 [Belonocnema kinseyi]